VRGEALGPASDGESAPMADASPDVHSMRNKEAAAC
jgi:hypothetical protein